MLFISYYLHLFIGAGIYQGFHGNIMKHLPVSFGAAEMGCITAKGTVFLLSACWKWRWFRHRGWIQWFRRRIDFDSESPTLQIHTFPRWNKISFLPLGPPFSTCGLKAWGHCGHCGYASAADAALSNKQLTFYKFLKNGRRQRDPGLDLGDLPWMWQILK